MKFFSWRNEPQWMATAHAESVAQARELLLGEVGGIDGSCVVRAKARQIISEEAPEIWMGPNAEFALTDSAELEEQDAEADRLRAELAAEKDLLIHAQNEIGQLKVAVSAANERLAELAAALERQAAKCRLWRDTFEGLDEDLFAAEAHNALSAIYDLTDDAEAQDTADAILTADRKAQRQKGAAWALREKAEDLLVVSKLAADEEVMVALRATALSMEQRADSIERDEVEVGE